MSLINKENTDSDNNITMNTTLDNKEKIYTDETLTKLRDGFLQIYTPKLETVKTQLHELTTKQNLLVEQMHNENLKIAWKHNSEEYQEMFRKIQIYRNKLLIIKTDMRTLHERSKKLVKRSTRIQNLKEKDDQQKCEEREKEQKLIASK